MFVLISHPMTEAQKRDAKERFGIEEFVVIDNARWKEIPPTTDTIAPILQDLMDFIAKKCNNGDYLFVQGDFGATYLMVNFAFKHHLIPVYATSKREVTEERDGEEVKTIRIFKHVRFRAYEMII
jgi:hypothetical protein